MKQTSQENIMWFSRFFGVEIPQYGLPFVDFNLYSDVPLYIDPYAISKDPSELAAHCHNAILSYFQLLIDTIRAGNKAQLRQLVRGRMAEPNEIHLGVSRVARHGRGLGEVQEQQVIDALATSEAAKVGVIQALQELELHIVGVGPDKISDLIANITLSYLSQFTEEICTEYGIATRPCAVSGYWNQDRREWDGGYFNLPARDDHSYILVPKRFVRKQKDLMNHREFYRKYVLDVIERELITANDSLVQTLKSGVRRVTKKSIQEDSRFAQSKSFLSQFVIEHPETIDQYRNDLLSRFKPVDPAIWSGKQEEDDPQVQGLLEELDTLAAGLAEATRYHKVAFELLQFVFDWVLVNFEIEYEMDQGRGRIDIITDNYAGGGLFAMLRQELNATSVPMECKNYTSDLGNDQFNQITDRLGHKTSRFGIMLCRTIEDANDVAKHQVDRWLRQENIILVFDDIKLKHLANLRLLRQFEEIELELMRMIRAVKYGN